MIPIQNSINDMKMKKYNLTNIVYATAFLMVTSLLLGGCISKESQDSDTSMETQGQLTAKYYNSGFDLATKTYNSISTASNGIIYYILSSHSVKEAGKMYSYDPETEEIEILGDLSVISGESDKKAIPQGKSHVNFYESSGKLYFSTHLGVYEEINGMERYPSEDFLPDGYDQYPGGHFLSYDLASGEFTDLAIAPHQEGILTMTMDKDRGQLYGITWPTGYFLHYNIEEDTIKNMGKISANGEAGTPGEDFRVLCRSMFVDPQDGSVYYSTSEGDIFYYNPESESINELEEVDLQLDYFGEYDPTRPGDMGYNWRRIVWNPSEEVAYGVHGNSGYLFRLDPREQNIEIVERITSEPSKKSGMFDQFYYGYLGFELGPDRETFYYLTGGPIYDDGERVEDDGNEAVGVNALENLHLVTYNIPNQEYTDYGPIFYQDGTRPTYANSIAIGPTGDVFTLANNDRNGKEIQDLVRIMIPE